MFTALTHNSHKIEITQMSISGQMNEQNAIQCIKACSGVLLGH